MSEFVGFQIMIILDPYDMAFEIVVVFGLDFDFYLHRTQHTVPA